VNIRLADFSSPKAPSAGEIRFNTNTNNLELYNGTLWTIVNTTDPLPTSKSWTKWRAWYPVRVHGKWTWLKTVYRYRVISPGGGSYRYGTIFDVIKDV
jgi:hypothetical protein